MQRCKPFLAQEQRNLRVTSTGESVSRVQTRLISLMIGMGESASDKSWTMELAQGRGCTAQWDQDLRAGSDIGHSV